jgi:hypothetical protein
MKKRFSVGITFHESKVPDAQEKLKRAYNMLISLAVQNILARQRMKEEKAAVDQELNQGC